MAVAACQSSSPPTTTLSPVPYMSRTHKNAPVKAEHDAKRAEANHKDADGDHNQDERAAGEKAELLSPCPVDLPKGQVRHAVSPRTPVGRKGRKVCSGRRMQPRMHRGLRRGESISSSYAIRSRTAKNRPLIRSRKRVDRRGHDRQQCRGGRYQPGQQADGDHAERRDASGCARKNIDAGAARQGGEPDRNPMIGPQCVR